MVMAPPSNGTALEARARSVLASSIRSSLGDGTHKLVYPAPCDGVDGVLDSTTTLLTARVFSKLGRSDLAWEFLRTLFRGQGANGFLPRYLYLNHTDPDTNTFEGARWEYFVGAYPGPKLFSEAPEGYVPQSSVANEYNLHPDAAQQPQDVFGIWSSNTLMALPYHATLILETFYLSNQTDADVVNMQFLYDKLQSWHAHLHRKVIGNCSASNTSNIPCLAVGHPWETGVDMSSSLWDVALDNVTNFVAEQSWKPGYDIPEAAKSAFDYPGEEKYNALLYLLDCLNNQTEVDIDGEQSSDIFHAACPFQMLDVGFAAALSKSDEDLIQIGQILLDKNRIEHPSWESIELAEERSERSKIMLNSSWDEDYGSFFNRVVNLTLDTNGTYCVSNQTSPLKMPLGYNFMAFWDHLSNATIVESMATNLLQHAGEFSFYCGDYPLWTEGGCKEPSPPLVFSLNYLVSRGLQRNNEVGYSRFLQSSSLNLLCGLPNSEEADLAACTDQRPFASAFNATSQPLGVNDVCGQTSTLTAAIALDMLIPDGPFKYESEPPISSSSVIILIAIEMGVAISVGIICLLLSLNLMRRAQADEEGDAFVQILAEQEEELLVQSPAEDTEAVEMTDPASWSTLLSRFSPMKLWDRQHTDFPQNGEE
ncbi:hypothetical protein ACHAXT_001531 [Thalassiosira profunda]